MKISIAMATYNGAMYLAEQLESFAGQTRLPDEVVICDDASSDRTVEVIEKFSAKLPFKLTLVRNSENLGYIKNFEKALTLCTGDIIFLSDQDDVWFKEKLEAIEKVFIEDSGVMLVINDLIIADAKLQSSGLSVFSNTQALGFSDEWICAGCSSAIRADFRGVILPFPGDLLPHDNWIHLIANLLKRRHVVQQKLQFYRRHGDNVSDSIACRFEKPNKYTAHSQYEGSEIQENWNHEIKVLNTVINTLSDKKNNLEQLGLSENSAQAVDYAGKKIAAIESRIRLSEMAFFTRLLKGAEFYYNGSYKYFSGWKSFAKDVAFPSTKDSTD